MGYCLITRQREHDQRASGPTFFDPSAILGASDETFYYRGAGDCGRDLH